MIRAVMFIGGCVTFLTAWALYLGYDTNIFMSALFLLGTILGLKIRR